MRLALFLITGSSLALAETPKPEKPALTKADPVPAIKGPVTKLEESKSAMIGGVKVTFLHAGHKHMDVDAGPSIGMWSFELLKGSKQETELRHHETGFESEVAAHGALLVFRHLDYTHFEIIAAGKAPKPLADDACGELIDKAAAKRSFSTEGDSSTSEDNGIVEKRTPTWRGYCGTLTKRVWFAPPSPRGSRKQK